MLPSLYERYRYLLLAAFACLLPAAIYGAGQALQSNANDVRTWLPEGIPESVEYAEFRCHFGSEEFVAASWDGSTLDDPRIEMLAERLADGPLVASVMTGPRALDQLMSPPAKLSRDEAIARLQGVMIGPDERQSCLLVRPTERGKEAPRELLELIRREAVGSGISHSSLRMGGPLVTSTSIDDAAARSLTAPGAASILAAFAFSWICCRSLRLTIAVIAVGAFSAAAALAVVYYTGVEMNAVLLSMPPLVYVATTSGAIHWANYYRETVAEGGLVGAPARAVLQSRLPLVLATATTSIGLLSLCASELTPIRHFGVYAAIGVAASLVWLLVLLPAVVAAIPPRSNAVAQANAAPSRVAGWWRVGGWIATRHWLFVGLCLAVEGTAAFGLGRIKTSVSAEEFFSNDAEFPQTSLWLEERLGGMVPMEILIRFDEDCELSTIERMEVVDRVQQSAAGLDNVVASTSAVTFSPVLPEVEYGRRAVRRTIFNKRLEKNRDRFIEAGFLANDGGSELWRVSLRTRSFHNVDQRYFIDAVRKRVEPVIAEERELSGSQISATYTGMVPLINRAQHSLLEGLCLGLLTDLALVVLTVVVLLRHWAAGVIVLATCVLPATIVLGLFGWLGISLDIGSVLAPSVALGVSIDDVLHFVLCYRRGLEQGQTQREAVRLAYRHCARAMFQSWGVIGVGLGIFAFSDFGPTHRFGLLMLLLVTVGLFVNLVLLPALLASPLGAMLARRPDAATTCKPEAAPLVFLRRQPTFAKALAHVFALCQEIPRRKLR